MDYLFGAITALVSFSLGFFFGARVKKNVNGEMGAGAREILPHGVLSKLKKGGSSPVGSVMRPTQQDILERTNPKDIAHKQEREAMRELLEPIFAKK